MGSKAPQPPPKGHKRPIVPPPPPPPPSGLPLAAGGRDVTAQAKVEVFTKCAEALDRLYAEDRACILRALEILFDNEQ